MSMREMGDKLKPLYVVPRDDIAGQVLIPAMSIATDVRCMAGFFDSGSFRQLAPGLATFLRKSSGTLRLLVSPQISTKDREAIALATKSPEEVLAQAAVDLFSNDILSESAIVRHTVRCLAFMLAKQRLDIRFVLTNRGMFHPKVWLLGGADDWLVAHGSSNPTLPGLLFNLETVTIERSWVENDRVEAFRSLFSDIWDGIDSYSLTISAPSALNLLRHCEGTECPTTADFWLAWRDDAGKGIVTELPIGAAAWIDLTTTSELQIPGEIRWQDGPFGHQGQAVEAWEANNRHGILAIATGGGKTISSLIAATRLQEELGRLFIVVSAPYRPLVAQWCDEAKRFGVTPIHIENAEAGTRDLEDAMLALESGHSRAEVAVITVTRLNDPSFREFLDDVSTRVPTLLIADEVHNLGAPGFAYNPAEQFEYRLGLSATPIRQYDAEGTDALLTFFGGVIYEFGLGDAIAAGCLTPYDYHIHPVQLNAIEVDEWEEITERLARSGVLSSDEDIGTTLSDEARRLLIRRRAILENASGKLNALRDLLVAEGPRTIHHTLIYTSAKRRPQEPSQISQVNLLLNDLGILAHELTYNQTGSGVAGDILGAFARGDYQAVTCMKVLDEGIDVPQTRTAYILSSSSVQREWVQRRGRVLRKAPGKSIACVHDFLVVPPNVTSKSGRAILRQEYIRALEFTSLARNSGANDGPWSVLARYQQVAT